ncbi:MAG TPA: rubredoxin [Chitinophaga sp.]|uniref:rubredoxin n=1 Tax=Chitinophaga sp. TaxID=1869181 RepID=UPI002BA6B1ED|nr:rubredoxin [Chitinophaga sp.]HVI47459.1 rubredoxin [Chitinophaga sp.]
MAKQVHTLQVNFTGGIISPGKLHELLDIVSSMTITYIRFGLRQQLLIDVPDKYMPDFISACSDHQINLSTYPNILSSYPAADIFINNTWLTEGIYKDVFNLFDYSPALKVNICDSRQTFVPLFTGHVNWVASGSLHYWYLYLRPPGSQQLYAWPELIYTNNIAIVTKAAEILLQEGVQPDVICQSVKESVSYIFKEKTEDPALPAFRLPYYEGFNRHHNTYWLGIYRRDEDFSVAFLKEVCKICMQTRIGQLYATPWKSLVIKDIEAMHRNLWDYVLDKHGINVRHAANELNWQVEDNCEDGLVLKRHIIRYFDVADVRTYGLCFSVKIQRPASLFGNIIIRRRENRHGSQLKYMQRYDIFHTAGFSANAATIVPYRQNVSKEHLGPYVAALCKLFYEQKSETDILEHFVQEQQQSIQINEPEHIVYQCSSCLTVYDPAAGDAAQGAPPGTPFDALPAEYSCSVCDAGVEVFKEVGYEKLVYQKR